jgi:hypothetical protein
MCRRPSTDAFDKRCDGRCLAISSVDGGEEDWVTNPKSVRYQNKTGKLRQPKSPIFEIHLNPTEGCRISFEALTSTYQSIWRHKPKANDMLFTAVNPKIIKLSIS